MIIKQFLALCIIFSSSSTLSTMIIGPMPLPQNSSFYDQIIQTMALPTEEKAEQPNTSSPATLSTAAEKFMLLREFGRIVGCVFDLARNPHTAPEVGSTLAQSVSRIIRIVMDLSARAKAQRQEKLEKRLITIVQTRCKQPNCPKVKRDQESNKRVLAHFAQMVGSMFAIAQHSQERDIVAANVANTLAQIVHIGFEVTRNRPVEEAEALYAQMEQIIAQQALPAHCKVCTQAQPHQLLLHLSQGQSTVSVP